MTSPKWNGVIGGHKWQLRAPTAVAAWASLQAQWPERPIPKKLRELETSLWHTICKVYETIIIHNNRCSILARTK